MGGAGRSIWVEFVEAICRGSHVVLHTVQEAIIVSTCCHTRRGRGHHELASPWPLIGVVTTTVILGNIIPLCC